MANRAAERRALFEAILSDPGASHAERLRADERLQELETIEGSCTSATEHLSPEEALRECESLAAAAPGMVALARIKAGANMFDAIRPPDDPGDLREVIDLQARLIDRLETTLLDREAALRRWTVQRALPQPPFPTLQSS